jgi:hypothetical protein
VILKFCFVLDSLKFLKIFLANKREEKIKLVELRNSSTPMMEKFPIRKTKTFKTEKAKESAAKVQEGFKLPSMKPIINFKNNNAKYFQNQNPALALFLKKIGVLSVS